MSTPQQVIVATFDATNQAEQVLPALEALREQLHQVPLDQIAILEKTPAGTVQVHEPGDARSALSRILGNVTGAVAWLVYGFFGVLPGPVAGEVAAGTTTEAVKRVIRDIGFDDAELASLGEALDAGSSALILVVPADAAPAVGATLLRLGGVVVARPFTPDLAAELEAGPPPDDRRVGSGQ